MTSKQPPVPMPRNRDTGRERHGGIILPGSWRRRAAAMNPEQTRHTGDKPVSSEMRSK